ncbi:hypothetical protein K443DRAFT_684111 [Laccaria amethystina LaAM-08-1]|uniref:Uncharacterized protein n=1 Tax=Laccaria amethystina LaAM-08-1 TaxID=1095629 RepID=A0A0C9WJ32_9AGAR|nr:hypothetical protein K443DRAFT_684111 [Laccaria amethystina LaAM-08-1]
MSCIQKSEDARHCTTPASELAFSTAGSYLHHGCPQTPSSRYLITDHAGKATSRKSEAV